MPKVAWCAALIVAALGLVAFGYLLDQQSAPAPNLQADKPAYLADSQRSISSDSSASGRVDPASPPSIPRKLESQDSQKANPKRTDPPTRVIRKLKPQPETPEPTPKTPPPMIKLPPGVRAPSKMDKNTRNIGVPAVNPPDKVTSTTPFERPVDAPPAVGPIPPREELIQQMKQGTALLFDDDGPIGAAFCVDQRGLFLTTSSVVQGLTFDRNRKMLVGSGNTSKIKTTFTVVGDGYNGLSLVLAGPSEKGQKFDFSPLRIGETSGLLETDELIIGGYSVIGRKNVSRNSWNAAALSILIKRIKTLKYMVSNRQRKVMTIVMDQEDDSSHFTQGGPVLDKNGLLIGIVGRVGQNGREIKPIHRFLTGVRRRTNVVIEAPSTISEADFAKAIHVKVKTPRLFTDDNRKLTVRAGFSRSRNKSLPVLEETSPNVFVGKAFLVSQSERERINFQTKIDGLTVKGSIKARKFKVGGANGRMIDLLGVERITWLKDSGPEAKIELRSGEELITTIDPDLWRNVPYVIGNRPLTVNFRDAKSVEFLAPDLRREYTLRVQVYDGRDRLSDFTHKIGMSRVPKLADVISSDPHDAEKQPAITATYSRQAIQLPAEPRDVCYGGGGKFMFIAMKGSGQIAIVDFDLKQRVGFLDAGCEDFLFAAGLSELFVLQKESRDLLSFDLSDFSKPATMRDSSFNECRSMAMGESSNTPLVIAGEGISVVDAQTLRVKGSFRGHELDPDKAHLRVSSNGHVTTYNDHRRLEVVQHEPGKKPKQQDSRTLGWGQVFPSFDGSWILTRNGVVRSGGDSLENFDTRIRKGASPRGSGSNSFEQLVPARSGDLYLSVLYEKDRKTYEESWEISLNQLGNEARLGVLPPIKQPPRFKNLKNPLERDITLEKQIIFDPARDIIGFLGDSQLFLFSLDINDVIKPTIGNYISIISLPPPLADRNKEYRYQLKSKTNVDRLIYSAPVAPEGLNISKHGLITWKPENLMRSRYQVIVSVSDGDDVEVFQRFDIRFR